jgi:hypothetical protein
MTVTKTQFAYRVDRWDTILDRIGGSTTLRWPRPPTKPHASAGRDLSDAAGKARHEPCGRG